MLPQHMARPQTKCDHHWARLTDLIRIGSSSGAPVKQRHFLLSPINKAHYTSTSPVRHIIHWHFKIRDIMLCFPISLPLLQDCASLQWSKKKVWWKHTQVRRSGDRWETGFLSGSFKGPVTPEHVKNTAGPIQGWNIKKELHSYSANSFLLMKLFKLEGFSSGRLLARRACRYINFIPLPFATRRPLTCLTCINRKN